MNKLKKIFILLILILVLCSCGKDKHEHEYKEKYSFDDTNHWYECINDDCNEKQDVEEHNFTVDREVLENESIEIFTYKCGKCEYSYTEEKAFHSHKASNVDKLYNDNEHYDECSCGEKLNIESHKLGEWIVDNEPTEEVVGKKHKECSVCEYKIEEEIPTLKHEHSAGKNLVKDNNQHWYECSCGEKINIQNHVFEDGYVKTPATPDEGGQIEYLCSICNYEKIIDTVPIEVNYLDINGFNNLDETGIKLFKFKGEIENNKSYYKVLLEKVGNYYKVIDIVKPGVNLTLWYDYVLMATPNDLTGEYDKLVYYLNINDYLMFSDDLESLNNGIVEISLFKTTEPETIKVEYDLGYEQFNTKEDLYNAYFTEFYNFLKTKTDCNLESFGIKNVDDFLRECLNWNFNGGNSFQGVGNAFAKYYVTIKIGDTLANQPTDTFVGYCYKNNKFKDFIEHLEVFFAYWRTDEGYTTSTNNGNDFFASAWAALVDTCKFFYFTSENITDTYKWFTKERSPRVHYMLDNIPGVGRVNLAKESINSIYLPTLSRMHYKFLGWYNESGEKISIVSKDTKVTAKWERIEYSVDVYVAGEVQTYKVKSGLRFNVPQLNISGYNINKLIDASGETFDIWNAVTKDEKIFVILSSNSKKIYNLFLIFNGGDEESYKYALGKGEEYSLPVPIKDGYVFDGWYTTPEFDGNKYTSIVAEKDIILYAKWISSSGDNSEDKEENQEAVKEEVLNYISDVVTSDTIDNLPTNINGVSVTYTTSDSKLYTIANGKGYTNRRYQTHANQKVTVFASLANGTKYSKEITINPVTYPDMSHPKAVYFSVSSASSYTKYSERYKQEKTMFSNKFKNNMNMVYYAFAIPQENGTLTLNTTYLEEVMELKNHGIRVLLVIDGANAAPLKAMVKLCDNATTRKTFVNNILNLVTKYNFDGVDVDWEFPGVLSSQSGYEKYTTAVDIKNLNSLLKELREGFNNLQDKNGSNYILSVATPPTYWGTDRFDYATINKYCDYVNMMSYDLNKSNTASHLTHVYQPNNSYSYKFCCDYGVSYYTSLGLDKSKIILGAAAYGKAYKVSGSTPNSKLPGLGMSGTLGQVTGFGLAGQSITWNSGTIYYTGIQTLINSGKFTQYNEYNNSGKLVGSYLYNASDNYFITFDSVLSVTEKCKYASKNEGMGIMVWAYGEDATDTIVNTICDNL